MRVAIFATLLGLAPLALAGVAVAQDDAEPPPRTLRDPAQALPSRQTGEAVMPAREAFDRETPQIRVGVGRDRAAEQAAAEAAGAQLVGDGHSRSHECSPGERVQLVGSGNIVRISGLCVGLVIDGNDNQVEVEVIDEIRINGRDNDVRWRRGLTVDRPNYLETGGFNTVGRLAAGADDEGG
ncbi:MAG: DUF3060 domain-containing protein [Xanthomonadales bacterium]|nr:DUF3060 domain-containing protein [Xanthomonadales bacterium]